MTRPIDAKRHTEVLHIAAVAPRTGEAIEAGAYGLLASGGHADAILRCAQTLEELRAVVGDLADTRARYELCYLVEPCIGPPWETTNLYSVDEGQQALLRELARRFAPHRQPLSAYVQEGCGGPSSARVVRLVELDPTTGAELEAWYGVWARGRFGPAITRSASSLAELRELVGGSLDDERAVAARAGRGLPHRHVVWGIVDPVASFL